MPISREGDISRRIARLLDAEPSGIAETVSPELVATILAGDVSESRQRRGIAAASIGAALGFRSEIAIVVVNGRLEKNEILFVPRIYVSVGTAINLQAMIEIPTAGFTPFNPATGDAEYGDIAPIVIQVKNSAALSAGGRNLFGDFFRIPVDSLAAIETNVTLRAANFYPRASNVLLLRPAADNTAIDAAFEWRVLPDVR